MYWSIAEQFARWTDIDIHYRGSVTRSAATGSPRWARELLGVLQERALELGGRSGFRPRRRLSPSSGGRTWWSPPTGRRARSEAAVDESVPSLDRRECKYMWIGTDLVFDASSSSSSRRPTGCPGAAYPYDDRMSTFIVETHARCGGARGSTGCTGAAAPGVSDEGSIERCRSCSRMPRGSLFRREQFEVDRLVTVRNRRWFCRQRGAARRRRPHGALLDRLGHEARDGGRGRLAWALRGTDDVPVATAAYEAERRPIVESTQRAAQASLEWFEGMAGMSVRSRSQFAFNLLTRTRRVTYENLRMRDAEFVEAVHPIRGRRCSRRSRCAGWSCPTASSSRRWTVLGRRRDAERLSPRTPRQPRARRRRAGDDRDDLRVGRGASRPAAPGCSATSTSPRGSGSSTSCTPLRRRDRHADRALGPQGVDEADVGGDRQAARGRQLAGDGAVGAAVFARATRCRAR